MPQLSEKLTVNAKYDLFMKCRAKNIMRIAGSDISRVTGKIIIFTNKGISKGLRTKATTSSLVNL